jgi:hypothetical protein
MPDPDETTHEMTITADHGGKEWWTCPACGRVLLIEWNPFSKITVVPGDEYAAHTGGKGGLKITGVEVAQG